ncbi:hypothetical protein SAY87_020719 [Trapa incisa]|uniref:Peptidase A1 domain-containing protein n=1 Tax=Trapa incisa TaxID=236973 RepID=A0AAN7PPM9_9MYRT|nr:hypothetical protein SAY87_020719 [Trapa incisa]
MALTVSIPIGTPPQNQDMVIDTGSQLSWIQCIRKSQKPSSPTNSSSSFDPSLSSSYLAVRCDQPACKPQIRDYTLPTSCDNNRDCHYSYFYADQTLAEGNLIQEKLAFGVGSKPMPHIILGCASADSSSGYDKGILGMNLGGLSFPSQANLSKFSYCIPLRTAAGSGPGPFPTGSIVLGENPSSAGFRFVDLMMSPQGSRAMPNFNPLAYTVPMQGIRIGAKRLDIPPSVFRPDAGGSGQTMIDSGSELTYLVDEAYGKVREEVVRLVGPTMKKGYTYNNGVADMCFNSQATEVFGRLVGGMTFEFEGGEEIGVPGDRVLAKVEDGVHCLPLGKSIMLGAAANIIGNIHQQNMWVEFDLVSHRVGFGKADCGRS